MFEDILLEGLFAFVEDPELFLAEFLGEDIVHLTGDFVWDAMILDLI